MQPGSEPSIAVSRHHNLIYTTNMLSDEAIMRQLCCEWCFYIFSGRFADHLAEYWSVIGHVFLNPIYMFFKFFYYHGGKPFSF